MGCISFIFYLMTLPLIISFYLLKLFIDCIVILVKFITTILGGFSNNSSNYSNNVYKNNKRKTNINKKTSYKDAEFEEQADLWGLSKSDRKIAKQERMSPADFIEAEERDDDELVTDEWE